MMSFGVEAFRQVLQDLLVPELRAIQQAVLDQGKRLDGLDNRLVQIDHTLTAMGMTLSSVDGRLAGMEEILAT